MGVKEPNERDNQLLCVSLNWAQVILRVVKYDVSFFKLLSQYHDTTSDITGVSNLVHVH